MQPVDDKLSFIRRALGSYELGRDGLNVATACPACRDSSKKKLAIRLDDDRVNCWVCGLHGRLIGVLKRYASQSLLHEYVTKFAGQNIRLFIDEKDDVALPIVMPKRFRLLARRFEKDDLTVTWALNYLRSRGVTLRDLWYFRFGISNDPNMDHRIIMPSFDAEGNLNFYTGRSVEPNAWRKYMNCDQDKKSIVFNELNIDWKKELTLVEGPFDLIKCDENATCLLGSSLSEDSLLFGRIYQNKTPILLALDSDMYEKSWQKIARRLVSYDIPVRILDLKQFLDVGEMSKKQFLECKVHAVEWNREIALRQKIKSLKV